MHPSRGGPASIGAFPNERALDRAIALGLLETYGHIVRLSHPLIAAAACKWFYWRAIDARPSLYSIEQATGLGRLGKVRQWEAPHTGANFVMNEMGYRIARRHAEKLRRYVLAAFFMAAATTLSGALTGGAISAALGVVSVLCAALAVLIERWLFFAEAQHVSTLYYGAPSG